MNQHQTERVRSYLRGRLQLAILPVGGGAGGFIVAPLGQATGSGDYYPTLEELAARHGVTIPESIMHGPLDNQPKPVAAATATAIERTEPMRVHKSLVVQFLRTHPDEREQVIPGWPGTIEEYVAELERRPGQFFVNGELVEEET